MRKKTQRPNLSIRGVAVTSFVMLILASLLAMLSTQTSAGSPPIGDRCDFDGSGECDSADLDPMYALGNLITGIQVASGNPFDLDGDLDIDNDDLSLWLEEAAAVNTYGSPYLRGDTDDVGCFDGERDVDITDFNTLATNFGTSNPGESTMTWNKANFDGDDDVDITDFNLLARNFTSGYGAKVPEPAGLGLAILGLGGLLVLLPSSRRAFVNWFTCVVRTR